MKKNYYFAVLVALLAYPRFLQAQNVVIDANALVAAYSTDLAKPFQIEFKNNKRASSVQIADLNLDYKIVKRNFITAQDRASYRISIDTTQGTLLWKRETGEATKVQDPIQIKYNDKAIVINKTVPVTQAPPTTTDSTSKKTPKELVVGIEIHDAIKARSLYNAKDKIALKELLRAIKALTDPTTIAARRTWDDNPFIKPLIVNDLGISATDAADTQGGLGVSGFISSVGNTDVTTITDGIAKFLVKRTKQELTIAFFQHFKDLLNEGKYKDVRILFPKTWATLNGIDENIYQYSNYIESLRSAFDQDFSLLLDHTKDVINEGRFKQYFNDHPVIKHSAFLTLFTAKELINSTHPGKILETLPEEDIEKLPANFAGAINTVQLLSSSLRARGSTAYWTSPDTLKMLLTKDDPKLIAAKFYLGFLYEKAKLITFEDRPNHSVKLSDLMKAFYDDASNQEKNIKEYIAFAKDLGEKTHDVEAAIAQIKAGKTDLPSAAVYHRMFDAFADVLNKISDVGTLPKMPANIIPVTTKDYINTFRLANNLGYDIAQKEYGAAVLDAGNVYLQILQIKRTETGTLSNPDPNSGLSLTAPVDGDSNLILTEKVKTASDSARSTVEVLFKYGSFMANMVKAKTSDEVAAAIESVALPVGSATIKKHSAFNISLNAYVGPYIGAEKIYGVDGKYKMNAYGLTAPIGINFSHGLSPAKRNSGSFSLFLSVIDLGAPVAFRFKDDKTSEVPSIKLKDIVSPGAFVSFGIPNAPLSINAGWQMGPLLRDLKPAGTTTADKTYGRWSLSIAVDIPVLNLYKSK